MAQLLISPEKKFMVIVNNGKLLYRSNYDKNIHDLEIRSCIIFAKMNNLNELIYNQNGNKTDLLKG